MRQTLILLCLLCLAGLVSLLSGCGLPATDPPAPASTMLTVFAAASLTEAFTDIATEFETNQPAVDLALNFAGSQALRLQIEQGARFDIFASANELHMQAVAASGLVEESVIFTHNRLVVILPAANPAQITRLADLAQPGLKLVLAAPAVPVGHYTRRSLEMLNNHPALEPDFASRVLANLVSEEDNVRGVVAKIRLGEADAGIVYASEVTPAVAADLALIDIPPPYNVQAAYPLAVSSESTMPDMAREFVDYLLSPAGQAILARHGFQPVRLQTAELVP